jgi:hypothetical protein
LQFVTRFWRRYDRFSSEHMDWAEGAQGAIATPDQPFSGSLARMASSGR